MENQEKDSALAMDLLTGNLTEKEKLAANQRLKNDAAFASLVKETEILIGGIRADFRAQKRKELADLEKQLPAINVEDLGEESEANFAEKSEKSENSDAKIIPLFKKKWFWAAAIFVGLVASYFLFSNAEFSSNEKLFAKHFNTNSIEIPPTRSNPSEAKFELIKTATNYFNQKDLAKAIPVLQDLVTNYQDTLSLYFLGIAQLAENQLDESIQNLKRFEKISDDIRFHDAYQFIALAYVRAGNLEAALEVLEGKNEPTANQLRADILLSMKEKLD